MSINTSAVDTLVELMGKINEQIERLRKQYNTYALSQPEKDRLYGRICELLDALEINEERL